MPIFVWLLGLVILALIIWGFWGLSDYGKDDDDLD